MRRMMTRTIILGVAALTLLGAAGGAYARPDTRGMSCAQAQDLVHHNGAVVLTTGQHTYDRYVADGRYCDFSEVPMPSWVRTSDQRKCMVGYVCRMPSYDDAPFR